MKDWRVAPGGGGTAAGTVVGGRAKAASSLAWACAIRTGTEDVDSVDVDDDVDNVDDVDDVLVVRAREELVVLVELCSAAVSISAAGATASPVAGVAAAVVVDVVLAELVVVVSFEALFTLRVAAVAAADLGTAVHCRPLMVVKKAPDGRPTDAIFNSQSLPDGRVRRGQSLRNEEKREKGIQIQAQTGREKRS